MQAAVDYAWAFNCDPMAFLDRPAEDLPVLRTLIDIAVTRTKAAIEEAKRGDSR